MTFFTLIKRSLRFHWRSHLGVVLGAAVGAAALIGALIVGDSVRASLREMALARLGNITFALDGGDRLFRTDLAWNIQLDEKSTTLPMLLLPGMATSENQQGRANRVQVLGVNQDFEKIVPWSGIPRDSVVLNRALAEQLQVKSTGAVVILRFKKPSALAREATLATKSDSDVAWRVRVHDILDDAHLGRFSLRANQSAVYNAFVNLEQLQNLVQQTNRANVILASKLAKGLPVFPNELILANIGLEKNWRLADAQLKLREIPGRNQLELSSDRIFLDPPAVEAAMAVGTNAAPVLTYLVNLMQAGTNATPYSMVAALPPSMLPGALADDEIIISQWLAEDLKIAAGAQVSLSYFLVDAGTQLIERTNTFKVRAVIPMDSPLADRTLMPEFPGIAEAESTSDWDAGFPLMHKIRTKDDQYWKQYRGTPKGFITLAAGQKLWGNRYGNLSAIRFTIPAGQTAAAARTALETNILARLKPAQLGLRFEPVREQALAAASNSQDFGGLFIGFSLFLIVAALILTALMFRFGLEQRLSEAGVLLAVGYPPAKVRRIFLYEGLALSAIGSVVGVAGGVFYARVMLHGLTTLWRDATGFSSLVFALTPMSLCVGIIAGVAVAGLSLWLVLRKLGHQPATELLTSKLGAPLEPLRGKPWFSIGALIMAAGLSAGALAAGKTSEPGLFFGGGALLLMGAVGLSRWWLGRMAQSHSRHRSADVHVRSDEAGEPASVLKLKMPQPYEDTPRAELEFRAPVTLGALAVRGAARRRGRSVATISLLACGSFLIASIGLFRLDAQRDADARSSGTGGFALIGEATLPVLRDLNLTDGREFYGLSDQDLAGVDIVPLRVRDGDEASCLNLNMAQRPRVMGVNPARLEGRFTFAGVIKGGDAKAAWKLLKRDYASQHIADLKPDEIPAIGDAASIQWALKSKIGNTLDYTDEHGRMFKLRLVGGVANSILQGNLLIDEEEFRQRFPTESGHRMFLMDVAVGSDADLEKRRAEVSATLTRALQNTGLEVTPAARRLEQFNAVQNTYLSTFQVLGGLGLLLGTAGLAVVVLRNMLERRAELALLLALGYRPAQLPRLVLREHAALLLLGLGIGVVAAVVAVAPTLLIPGTQIPYRSLGLTLGAVLASGFFWTWLAARLATRGQLLNALRNE